MCIVELVLSVEVKMGDIDFCVWEIVFIISDVMKINVFSIWLGCMDVFVYFVYWCMDESCYLDILFLLLFVFLFIKLIIE